MGLFSRNNNFFTQILEFGDEKNRKNGKKMLSKYTCRKERVAVKERRDGNGLTLGTMKLTAISSQKKELKT